MITGSFNKAVKYEKGEDHTWGIAGKKNARGGDREGKVERCIVMKGGTGKNVQRKTQTVLKAPLLHDR